MGSRKRPWLPPIGAWESDYGVSEGDDPYFHLCFGKLDPLDEEFRDLAMEILGPILKCEENAK